MFSSYSLFVSENEIGSGFVESNNSFAVNETTWVVDQQTDDCLYQQIVYKVCRQPRGLISHLQRIYFSYQHGMVDQLYAALVDLLWVLEGKGIALSQRMVSATASLLSEQQSALLKNYLVKKDVSDLQGNHFSVFTPGIIGVVDILIEEEKLTVQHDPLMVARDYIEYSQLDLAIDTLEQAVLETPERKALQIELLDLYKVTKDNLAFMKMSEKLSENQVAMSVEWQDTATHFSRLNNER